MYCDYHVHTDFSGDCDMPLEVACREAIELGVKEIAVTDHLDIDYPKEGFNFHFDYDTYSSSLVKAQKRYGEQLSIIKGLEIGLQPHVLAECHNYLQGTNFDFIIAAVHAVDRKDLYSGEFFAGRDKRTAFEEYLEDVYFCLKGFERYHVLGHIDLVRRYGNYRDNSMEYADYKDLLDLILKELIDRGKGLEINTSGLHYGLDSPHPSLTILKRYRELGGEIITIGSDAHTPGRLGENFPLACRMAREAGFKYIARFPGGKPELFKF